MRSTSVHSTRTSGRFCCRRARTSSMRRAHLLYMRERVLVAQRFDAKRLRLAGEPVPLAEGVQYDAGYFRGTFSVSDNGVLVYAAGAGTGTNTRLGGSTATGSRSAIRSEIRPSTSRSRSRPTASTSRR